MLPYFIFIGLIGLSIMLFGLAAFFRKNNFGGIFFFIASALLLMSGMFAFNGLTTNTVTGYSNDFQTITYETLLAVPYEPFWVLCAFLSFTGIVGILASTALMGYSLWENRKTSYDEVV